MATANHDADAAFATLLRVTGKLDDKQLELCFDRDGHIGIRKRVAPSSSFLGGALHAILTCIVGIVVATYLLAQAMEAISLLLSPNTGIVLKGDWLVSISICGIFIVILVDSHIEDNVGPVNFPRWMVEAFD